MGTLLPSPPFWDGLCPFGQVDIVLCFFCSSVLGFPLWIAIPGEIQKPPGCGCGQSAIGAPAWAGVLDKWLPEFLSNVPFHLPASHLSIKFGYVLLEAFQEKFSAILRTWSNFLFFFPSKNLVSPWDRALIPSVHLHLGLEGRWSLFRPLGVSYLHTKLSLLSSSPLERDPLGIRCFRNLFIVGIHCNLLFAAIILF